MDSSSTNVEKLENVEIDYNVESLSFVLDGHRFVWSKGYWYFRQQNNSSTNSKLFYIGRKLPYNVFVALLKFIDKLNEEFENTNESKN